MYLPTLDLSNVNVEQQWEKVKEELEEVREAFCDGTKTELLEECLDLIQATKGLIEKIATIKQIETAFMRHQNKLEGRHNNIIGEWRVLMLKEAWRYDERRNS